MKLVNAIHKLSDLLNWVSGLLCVVLITAMVLVTGAQILCRVFVDSLTWSEELTRYLMIWATFLGTSVVYKHSGHINVSILQDHVPPMTQKLLKLLVHLVCGAVCAVAVCYGFKYMKMQGTQLSAALRVPMRLMYLAIPVGCLLTEVHVVDGILQLFFPTSNKKEVTAQ